MVSSLTEQIAGESCGNTPHRHHATTRHPTAMTERIFLAIVAIAMLSLLIVMIIGHVPID
jgi:hypothetical protein